MLVGVASSQRPGDLRKGKEGGNNSNNLFRILLRKSGAVIDDATGSILLDSTPAEFRRHLHKSLISHPSFPSPLVTDLLNDFCEHISDPDNFRGVLTGLGSTQDSVQHGPSYLSESIIKILLTFDDIQPALVEILLEKLPEYSDTTTMDASSFSNNFPKLILNQFRFLEIISNPGQLSKKFLEILGIMSVALQREMISILPEVIDDSQHGAVIDELKTLMTDVPVLTIPILDTISNLTLDATLVTEIHETLFESLSSFDVEALPVILRFFLQTTTPDRVDCVINSIRQNVSFEELGRLRVSAQSGKGKGKSRADRRDKTDESLMLDSIKSGMRFHQFVFNSWTKTLEVLSTPDQHTQLDFITLIILMAVSSNFPTKRKKIDALLLHKVKKGLLTVDLVQRTIKVHHEGLVEYFDFIINLSRMLLSISTSKDQRVQKVASAIYSSVFQVGDGIVRQKIIGDLVELVGTGKAAQIDAAFSALNDLVHQDSNALNMTGLAVFIQGLLDHLESFSLAQIATLFDILAEIGVQSSDSSLYNEIFIIVRKHLSNPTDKYKKTGVVGALSLIKKLAYSEEEGETIYNTSGASTDPKLIDAIEILNLVRSSCQMNMPCSILLFDSLSYMILDPHLHPSIIRSLQDWLTDFERFFVIDVDDIETIPIIIKRPQVCDDDEEESGSQDGARKLCVPPLERWFDECPAFGENAFAIKIFPIVMQSLMEPAKNSTADHKELITILCSYFRLTASVSMCLDPDFDDISGLVACGIVMPKAEWLSEDILKIDPEWVVDIPRLFGNDMEMKLAFCSALFYAINWLREVVNIFSSALKFSSMCLQRINDILQLENILCQLLPHVAIFSPLGFGDNRSSFSGANAPEVALPEPLFDEDALDGGMNTVKGRGGKSSGKKSKKARTSRSDDEDIVDKKRKTAVVKKSMRFGNIETLRPYMRELSLNYLNLLGFKEETQTLIDHNRTAEFKEEFLKANGRKANDGDLPSTCHYTNVVNLDFQRLKFILSDLHLKLKQKLVPVAANPFGRKSADQVEPEQNLLNPVTLMDRMSALQIISTLVESLPVMCKHLEGIVGEIQDIANNAPEEQQTIDFLKEHNDMFTAFDLLFGCLHCIFSWPDLTSTENESSLRLILAILACRIKMDDDAVIDGYAAMPLQQLGEEAFMYLQNFSKTIPTIKIAITYILLLGLVAEIVEDDENKMSRKVGRIASDYLSAEWPDKRDLSGKGLCTLLHHSISRASNPIRQIDHYSKTVFPALVKADVEVLEKFPFLNKETFSLFYKVVSGELNNVLDNFSAIDCAEYSIQDKMKTTKLIMECFKSLLETGKDFEKTQLFVIMLRSGRSFIEGFRKHVIKFMNENFRDWRADIATILREVQLGTRTLQHMCSHSKVVRDNVLVSLVPQLRKSLESLLYDVKLMLEQHNCLAAFWLGTLKHRTLQGEIVSSQIPVYEDSDDEDTSTKRKRKSKATSKKSAKKPKQSTPEYEVLDVESDGSEDHTLYKREKSIAWTDDESDDPSEYEKMARKKTSVPRASVALESEREVELSEEFVRSSDDESSTKKNIAIDDEARSEDESIDELDED